MSTGPFLYDDDPAPLHTGTPRNRNGLILALLGGTALFAVVMVVVMTLFKGSGEDQAREVAGVFAAALSEGDIETAYALICDDERNRVVPDELAAELTDDQARVFLTVVDGTVAFADRLRPLLTIDPAEVGEAGDDAAGEEPAQHGAAEEGAVPPRHLRAL